MCQSVFPPHHSYAPRKTIIFVLIQVILTSSVTVNKLGRTDIVAKTKIELRPLLLPCFLNDVVRISAPMINEPALYYLHKPSGEAMQLDIKNSRLQLQKPNQREIPTIVTKFVNNVKPIVTQSNNYDIFSFSMTKASNTDFDLKVKELDPNDFMLGPLTIEDNGNWVLSAYTKDLDGDWIELFQVISVSITEYLPAEPTQPILKIGDTFNLSFAIPVPGLESCEVVAPRTTFDKFFERNLIERDSCGYVVPNITLEDKGIWRIIGVGKIVYETEVYLDVIKD